MSLLLIALHSSARVQRLVERKKERCLRRAGTPSHIKSSLLSSDACGGLFAYALIDSEASKPDISNTRCDQVDATDAISVISIDLSQTLIQFCNKSWS